MKQKIFKVLSVLILMGLIFSSGHTNTPAQAATPAAPEVDDFWPTYRGYWDGYLWFSWTTESIPLFTPYVYCLVDERDVLTLTLDLYDPVLPQLWWRVRIPAANESILVYLGWIGYVPIEGLPVTLYEGVDFFNIYLPLIKR